MHQDRSLVAFTKYCPSPGPTSLKTVEAAVDLARTRMGVNTVDLMQFHVWKYEDSYWM